MSWMSGDANQLVYFALFAALAAATPAAQADDALAAYNAADSVDIPFEPDFNAGDDLVVEEDE